MTKTLTKQWRNGTLEQRYYYVKYFLNGQKPFVEIELKNFLLDLVKVKDSDKIEVLAPVPDYNQFVELTEKVKKLESRMKDAEEALKDFCDDCTLPKCCGCDEDCAGWKAKEYFERYGVK